MSRIGLVLLGALVMATRVVAQQPTEAESLLANGRVAPAESILFQAATNQPHDPEARIALGRYLAARGALRVAAVLLEEARLFGADTRRVGRELAPLYRTLGDYQSLVTLAGSPLTREERSQAAWLVSHQPTLEMDDTASVAYRAPVDTGTLGRVTLQIGSSRFDASVDPRKHGIVLDASRRRLASALFSYDSSATLGVLEQVRLGSATLGNVTVAFQALGDPRRAIIGLDVLMKLAPTFDAQRHHIVLRRGGRVAQDHVGDRYPVLFEAGGVRVLRGDHFVSLTGAEMTPVLRDRAWTLDVRRGELLVEP
jgi:tetratricopeptide (TPR) repeat protein